MLAFVITFSPHTPSCAPVTPADPAPVRRSHPSYSLCFSFLSFSDPIVVEPGASRLCMQQPCVQSLVCLLLCPCICSCGVPLTAVPTIGRHPDPFLVVLVGSLHNQILEPLFASSLCLEFLLPPFPLHTAPAFGHHHQCTLGRSKCVNSAFTPDRHLSTQTEGTVFTL